MLAQFPEFLEVVAPGAASEFAVVVAAAGAAGVVWIEGLVLLLAVVEDCGFELWFCEFGTVEDELAMVFTGVWLFVELGGLVVESFHPVVEVVSFIEL